jgi:predicted ATPase
MILEDAHWTDPTSLEVLGRIVDRIRSLPVLLLVTFRPEFDPPWLGRPYVTALTINRLAERDITSMIESVVTPGSGRKRRREPARRCRSTT